jgi:hypothetical protein
VEFGFHIKRGEKMSQDLRLTPKFRDTYAYFVHGLIKEPVLTEDDQRLYLYADPSLLETRKNQLKDYDVQDCIKSGLRPISDRLGENGVKTNALLTIPSPINLKKQAL